MELNKIYHNDWMNNNLADKSVQLIIADPPYFEVKGEFDFVWKTFDDYLQDVERWAIECKRVLTDNGTLYWYGDAKNIAYAQIIFDKHFILLNSLVWENTNDHKQQIRFNTDLRTFAPLTERVLMYANQEAINKATLIHKDYFVSIINKIQETAKIEDFVNCLLSLKIASSKDSAKVLASYKLGNHKTRFDLLSKEMYDFIGGFNYSFIELENEYRNLKDEYEEIRRPFNNERFYGDVIRIPNYETGDYAHDTIKPEKLTRELILISSRPNDLVLIPFSGSGTECAMSAKENRNFIGFDVTEKYVTMGNKRCNEIFKTPSLF